MKDRCFSWVFIAATILAPITGTKDVLLPLLPALPLPDVRPTPEYKPAASACQTLNINHTGTNASQEPGAVSLCQPSPAPTQPTNIVGTTTSRVVKTTTTTNTTTTEVRTITTTTTTTIEATTTSTNATVPMDPKPCVVSEASNGTQYNWWQILLETGGKPGTLKGNKNPDNPVLDSPPVNPCVRPLESEDPRKYAYRHEESDGKTYIRKEIGYSRFYGSPNEFLDVRGELVWRPLKITDDKRTYFVNYIVDDTGFWVKVSPSVLSHFVRLL